MIDMCVTQDGRQKRGKRGKKEEAAAGLKMFRQEKRKRKENVQRKTGLSRLLTRTVVVYEMGFSITCLTLYRTVPSCTV